MEYKNLSIEFEETDMASGWVSENLPEDKIQEITDELWGHLDPYIFESEVEMNIIEPFIKKHGDITKENWREFCDAVLDYFYSYDLSGGLDDPSFSGHIVDDSIKITDNTISFTFDVSARHSMYDISVGQEFSVRISLKDAQKENDGE